MSLIVEDGTGLATAESFASVTYADTYHGNRNNALWTGAQNVKEGALRMATDYMEQAYRLRWASFKTTSTQRLGWPRAWVPIPDAPSGYGSQSAYIPNNVVPDQVQQACAELALRALIDGNLNPPLTKTTTREKVGPIEVDYQAHGRESTTYRNVEMLLSPFMTGTSSAVGLVRV